MDYRIPRGTLIGDDRPPRAVIGEAVGRLTRDLTAQREALAREAVRRTLRPRLRWAARRPRALRTLRRLGLWSPPALPFGPVEIDTRCEGDAMVVSAWQGAAGSPTRSAVEHAVRIEELRAQARALGVPADSIAAAERRTRTELGTTLEQALREAIRRSAVTGVTAARASDDMHRALRALRRASVSVPRDGNASDHAASRRRS